METSREGDWARDANDLNERTGMDWRFWRRTRRDAELEEEIAHDLWLEAEERVASGLSRADAERASRTDFGNVALVKEAAREAWTWRSLEILAQDLRYAVRTLGRSRAFATTAIATLALGIGVNAATFTIFDQIAFRPLPVKDGDQIVSIYETFHGRFDRKMHGNIHMLSYPEFVSYQAQNRVFTEVAASAGVRRLTLAGAQPEAVSGLLVTDRYFSVLGAGIALGRTFRSDEAPQAEAVLSDGYWQRRFGGDPEILGKTIRLNQTVFTIVGVMAPGFIGTTTTPPDIWLPLSAQPEVMADLPPGEPQNFLAAADLSWLNVVGKLKPHVTVTEARTDLGFLASQMDRAYPGRVTEVNVLPSTFLSNPDARPAVLIGGSLVLVAVGLVLFVACANVANLLLARATARQREIAVRLSIGASRARVVRQLLTESSLLALAGTGLGLFLAQQTLDAGRRIVGLQSVDLSLDVNVLAYTLLLSIATSVMFGLIPALQATTPNLSGALKDEGAMPGVSMRKTKLRSRLISAQVAVCCILLVGAGLLVRGLMNLTSLDPGFRVKNVFVTDVVLPFPREDRTRAAAFYRELLSRIDAQTGGQSALAAVPPFYGVRIVRAVALDGAAAANALREVNSNVVSRNYFDVMGIHLFQGRTFTEAEASRGDPVAIVSEAMAKAYWAGENPIGKRFLSGTPGRMQSAEVIGVVNDVRSIHVATLDGPLFYMPAGPADALKVVTRSAIAAPLSKTIQTIVRQLDPAVLASVRTLEDDLEHETSPTRVAAGSALLLGGLALLLAAVGIYGMTAYVISQRTNEIGVRMALGARRSIILRWTVSEAMRPVAVGIGVGLPLAAIASKAAAKLLLGVHPFDPLAFVAVTAFLGIVALIASVVPARRAIRVDPAVALRHG